MNGLARKAELDLPLGDVLPSIDFATAAIRRDERGDLVRRCLWPHGAVEHEEELVFAAQVGRLRTAAPSRRSATLQLVRPMVPIVAADARL